MLSTTARISYASMTEADLKNRPTPDGGPSFTTCIVTRRSSVSEQARIAQGGQPSKTPGDLRRPLQGAAYEPRAPKVLPRSTVIG